MDSENAERIRPTTPVAEEEGGLVIRDRLLLYVRGLDIDAELSLELALEAARRARAVSDEKGMGSEAMDALWEILRERGLSPEQKNNGGPYLCSTPGLNRCSMIAEELDISPLRRLGRSLFKKAPPTRATSDCQ